MRINDETYKAMPAHLQRLFRQLPNPARDEVRACFPQAPGQMATVGPEHGDRPSVNTYGDYGPRPHTEPRIEADKSAARFFKECRFMREDLCQENSDRNVESAETQSDSCATLTVAEAAAIKTSDFKSEELPVTPGCTGNCENCTQCRCRAGAESQENTDTTTTTANHSKSNGCAPRATDENTNSGSAVVAEDDSVLARGMRFVYCPKASKKDRDEGCESLDDKVLAMSNQAKAEQARGNLHSGNIGMNTGKKRKNNHPTVKPTELMRYLCRLVTPPGGLILDPFMGSGSTGKAAISEGFRFIGIDLNHEYIEIARARIADAERRIVEQAMQNAQAQMIL